MLVYRRLNVRVCPGSVNFVLGDVVINETLKVLNSKFIVGGIFLS